MAAIAMAESFSALVKYNILAGATVALIIFGKWIVNTIKSKTIAITYPAGFAIRSIMNEMAPSIKRTPEIYTQIFANDWGTEAGAFATSELAFNIWLAPKKAMIRAKIEIAMVVVASLFIYCFLKGNTIN